MDNTSLDFRILAANQLLSTVRYVCYAHDNIIIRFPID